MPKESPKTTPVSTVTTDDELLTLEEVCVFFGGKAKPLNPATLYKGAKKGRYPSPVKIGPQISRWLKSEVVAAMARLIAARKPLAA